MDVDFSSKTPAPVGPNLIANRQMKAPSFARRGERRRGMRVGEKNQLGAAIKRYKFNSDPGNKHTG